MPRLRDYQERLILDISGEFRRGCRCVLAVMPTGAGKATTVASIASRALALSTRTLVLAHRGRLVRQLSGTLAQWGVAHGVIAPGYPETDHACQVGSVQTVARRLSRLRPPGLIILDEAHHLVRGNTWGKIIDAFPGAFLLGKTATPERLSGEGMGENHGGYFQSMIVGPSAQWLTDQGFLARARIFAPPSDLSAARLRKRSGDYDMKQAEPIAVRLTGDGVRHFKNHFPRQETALAFCTTVDHSRQVAAEFCAAGIAAESLDGAMEEDMRDEILDRLSTGDTRVVASVAVLGEGIDIPGVNGVLLYRPTASLSLFKQMIGRALRPKPDGSEAIILDHAGNALRHGLPTDHHEWSLEGKKRREKQEKVSVRQCPKCYAALPAGTPECPCCGHVFETQERLITTQDADLQELKQSPLKHERAMANTYEDLLKIGIARKMRNPAGWARHVMAARSLRAGKARVHT